MAMVFEPFVEYEDLIYYLNKTYKKKYEKSKEDRYRMVGILFARPNSLFTKTNILPHLNYFHQRSSNNFDIFAAGYEIYPHKKLVKHNSWYKKRTERDGDCVYTPIAGVDGKEWIFSDRDFNLIRKNFADRTYWYYSGSADLILTNAYLNNYTNSFALDFSSAIVCKLEKMRLEKAIISVESFIEDICRHVEQFNGKDPTWGFSKKVVLHETGSAIKKLILSLLPKKFGEDIKHISHFAVSSISRNT